MGKLGGTLLGSDGLSALVHEPGLSIGDGLEGHPDGPDPGALVENLLSNDSGDFRLVNDAGDFRLISS